MTLRKKVGKVARTGRREWGSRKGKNYFQRNRAKRKSYFLVSPLFRSESPSHLRVGCVELFVAPRQDVFPAPQ